MVISLRYRQVEREREAARQSASLAALAVILALVVAGLWLTDELRAEAGVQDCVLSGRVGCVAGVG
jgi:hypothetical protein